VKGRKSKKPRKLPDGKIIGGSVISSSFRSNLEGRSLNAAGRRERTELALKR